jgi:hypothetical protein
MDQNDLTAVGTTTQLGGCVYVAAGFFHDWQGGATTARVGALMSALEYLGIYLCTTGAVDGMWPLRVFFFFAFQGCAWMEVSASAIQVINFPKDRGLVLGLLYVICNIGGLGAVILVEGFFGTSQGPLSTASWCLGQNEQ